MLGGCRKILDKEAVYPDLWFSGQPPSGASEDVLLSWRLKEDPTKTTVFELQNPTDDSLELDFPVCFCCQLVTVWSFAAQTQ